MADKKVYRASTTAPVNIAVIKYWGKRDTALNLPTNSSISVTLSQSDLRTHTTASCSASYPPQDTLLLNKTPHPVTSARTQACLRALRSLRHALEASDPTLPPLSTYPLKIVSENNFPTAAGLASSAAGLAALVRAIADLYTLPATPTELSIIARQGSGSACRSLFGGYVAWRMGTRADGEDSIAESVAPLSHWPTMRALILVVSAEAKGVSSTSGMQATVQTSSLFPIRATDVVPRRMEAMEKAILDRDFDAFARITMRESNSFHATCLDTEPPIFYMNDVSRAAVRVVEGINKRAGKVIAAYTFDAGPNAVIYFLEESAGEVLSAFKGALGRKEGWVKEKEEVVKVGGVEVNEEDLDRKALTALEGGVSRVIFTRVGEGPVSVEEHLVGEDGEPVGK
ncbi:MAG: diphosphomevalonate decarboxylase [Cirrosporium novae-zelandiae]|nr:MAG: diphosphomevalonate decarboxylase [Cirrosporium novae-zelandiae]